MLNWEKREMKNGVVPLAKKRWKCLLAIAVLALVFLSMLVPLVFLLGQHNSAFFLRSTTTAIGYGIQQQSSTPNDVRVFDQHNAAANERNQTKDNGLTNLDGLINRLAAPTIPNVKFLFFDD